MSSLLATAALSTATLLPVPLLPPEPAPQETQAQPVQVSAVVDAPDGRLRRGCKDYRFTYAVSTPSSDWTLDLSMTDRRGRGVNSQALIGPNDATSGTVVHRLCRWATVPGLFTIRGVLVSYDGTQETTATVTETFRLRRRNP